MGLLARLKSLELDETPAVLERAAKERYWDGLELATCKDARLLGAIYLAGYVAEILLKVALFRFHKWPADKRVNLREIENLVDWRGYNFHDIGALAAVLIAERENVRKPLDSVFAAQLAVHAATLKANWRETLRYCSGAAQDSEAEAVFQSVDWVLTNKHRFWR